MIQFIATHLSPVKVDLYSRSRNEDLSESAPPDDAAELFMKDI